MSWSYLPIHCDGDLNSGRAPAHHLAKGEGQRISVIPIGLDQLAGNILRDLEGLGQASTFRDESIDYRASGKVTTAS